MHTNVLLLLSRLWQHQQRSSARAPRLGCYLIGCHSACTVAALRALSTPIMRLSSFYPSPCPLLFHSPFILFLSTALKGFCSFMPFLPRPLHFQTSIKVFICNAKILITDILRSQNAAETPAWTSSLLARWWILPELLYEGGGASWFMFVTARHSNPLQQCWESKVHFLVKFLSGF